MAGVPVLYEWGYFREAENSFPPSLLEDLIKEARLPGVLGNCQASGTEIIARLGEEHMRTGKPIVYTSADSVFQIAAHEETFGLERLVDLCLIARRLVDPYRIARVIARPFVGSSPKDFTRTGNRHDYAVPPPSPTVLDKLVASGGEVIGIGKIPDIFAHRGISREVHAFGQRCDVRCDARSPRERAGSLFSVQQLRRLRHALRSPARCRRLRARARAVRRAPAGAARAAWPTTTSSC